MAILVFVIGLFLPSKAHVERSRTIPAKPTVVFNLINDLNQWPKWSAWHQIDLVMKVDYQNGGVGKGAGYTWTSNHPQVGNGKLEIIESVPFEKITTTMDFGQGGLAYGNFLLTPEGENTNVVWSIDMNNDNAHFLMKPINNIFNLFMDKMIGPDFEKGLMNLETLAKSIPEPGGRVDQLVETTSQNMFIVQIESQCAVKEIGAKLAELYGRIGSKMKEAEIEQVGPPMARYPDYKPTDTITNIVAFIPTNKLCNGKDPDVKCLEIKAQKVIKATYLGPYEMNAMAYEAISKYVKEKNMEIMGEPWEEYQNDPTKETDPSKYITNVYWPVK